MSWSRVTYAIVAPSGDQAGSPPSTRRLRPVPSARTVYTLPPATNASREPSGAHVKLPTVVFRSTTWSSLPSGFERCSGEYSVHASRDQSGDSAQVESGRSSRRRSPFPVALTVSSADPPRVVWNASALLLCAQAGLTSP